MIFLNLRVLHINTKVRVEIMTLMIHSLGVAGQTDWRPHTVI